MGIPIKGNERNFDASRRLSGKHFSELETRFLEKSKDKTLTKAISSCFDPLFGNVIGFTSMLEEEDAVPLMVDEK